MMRKSLIAILAILVLSACTSTTSTQTDPKDSTEVGTLEIDTGEIADSFKSAGAAYLKTFFNSSYSYDMSELYAYSSEEIPDVIIGQWKGKGEYNQTYSIDYVFNSDGSMTRNDTSSSLKQDSDGNWEVKNGMIEVSDLDSPYCGPHYLCYLDEDHVLLFRYQKTSSTRVQAAPYVLERVK